MAPPAQQTPIRAHINVTPLIDVLLVLLITFMVITPLMPKGIDALAPPQAPPQHEPENAIVLQIAADGSFRLNGTRVALPDLRQMLHAIYANRNQQVLFVDAPKNVEYRLVMHALDLVRSAD